MRKFRLACAAIAVMLPVIAVAQDSVRVVILSPRVGQVVDREERDRYGLFRVIPDFHAALFFTRAGRYYGKLDLVSSGAVHDTLIEYRELFLRQMAERINNYESLLAGKYTMGTSPAALLPGATLSASSLGIDLVRLSTIPALELQAAPAAGETVARPGVTPPASDLAAAPVRQPDDLSRLITLRLRSGSVVKGRIVKVDTAAWHVNAEGLGEIRIPVSEILAADFGGPEVKMAAEADKSLTGIETAVRAAPPESEYTYGDPSCFRGFLLPTAFTLNSGDVFVENDELVLGTVGGGLSDHVMMSGGTFLIPSFFDENLVLHFGFKARITDEIEGAALAIGLHGMANLQESGVPLLPFAVATVGDADANFSVLGGFATILGEECYDGDCAGFFMGFSGQARISEGVKLLVDAAYLPGSDAVPLIIGVRFFGRHMSGDIGFLGALGEESDFLGSIPFANFTIFL